jgi:hypothetical protein
MVQSISFDPILSGDLVGLGGFEDGNHQDPRRDLTSFSVATPVLDYIVPAGISLRVIDIVVCIPYSYAETRGTDYAVILLHVTDGTGTTSHRLIRVFQSTVASDIPASFLNFLIGRSTRRW